jgi:FMN-dependent NADH-azoreductase
MTRILQINSSVFGDEGISSQLADDYVERLRAQVPALDHRRWDLAEQPIPHLTQAVFTAGLTPVAERDANQRAAAALADSLIEELEWADELVLGVPMYNLGLPTPLKAWFDHVARAGRTFDYTPSGPVGRLDATRARVFTSRGGRYDRDSDLALAHARQLFGLLGIADVAVVTAGGLHMGADHRAAGLAEAERAKEELLAAA